MHSINGDERTAIASVNSSYFLLRRLSNIFLTGRYYTSEVVSPIGDRDYYCVEAERNRKRFYIISMGFPN